jgi:transcriptional regulator
MHPNPIFRRTEERRNITFAQERGFGSVAINADDGPLISHIPFRLSDDGSYLEAHLVRSNPIYRALEKPVSAVIAISGGDGYISPDWYQIDDQVPTWNYVAVHLRGTLRRLPASDLVGVLERLSNDMESRLLPKPIWTLDKVTDEPMSKMMRQIMPVAMDITDIEGTWKLSQNKSDDVRLRAADRLASDGFGLEKNTISELMRKPPA